MRNIDGLLREVRQEQAQQEDLTNVARLQAEYITQANQTGLDPQTLSLAEDVLGESLEAAEREDQQEQIQQMFPSGAQREGAGRGDSYEYDISMFKDGQQQVPPTVGQLTQQTGGASDEKENMRRQNASRAQLVVEC